MKLKTLILTLCFLPLTALSSTHDKEATAYIYGFVDGVLVHESPGHSDVVRSDYLNRVYKTRLGANPSADILSYCIPRSESRDDIADKIFLDLSESPKKINQENLYMAMQKIYPCNE